MTNVSLNIQTRQCVPDNHFLGYEGENEINKLIFKFTDGFFDGAGLLNVKRGEQKGYVTVNKVEDTYELPVKNSLLSQKGDVIFQLAITSTTGTVIKFDPFVMTVKDSIDTDAELPEEYPSWQQMIETQLARMDNISIEASKEGKVTTVSITDKDDITTKTEIFDGEDGYSPSAKVTQTEYGAKIEITDAEGTTTATIQHGSGSGGGGGIVVETDPVYMEDKPYLALKTEIPTNLSQLENDAGYITEEDIPSIPTKTSDLENDSQFATEEFVKNKIAEAELGGEGGDIDLSGYATKEELNTKVDKVEGKSLIDDTEIERLANVDNYDDTEIKEKLNNIDQDISDISQDLTEINQELNNKANTNDIPTVPTKVSSFENDSKYATETYVEEEIAKFDFIKVVDALPETGLPNRIYFVPKSDTDTQDLFDEYAWINESWEYITTKQIEVDLTEYAKKSDLESLATIEYVDNVVGNIETLLSEV